jgi:hypothetical protein
VITTYLPVSQALLIEVTESRSVPTDATLCHSNQPNKSLDLVAQGRLGWYVFFFFFTIAQPRYRVLKFR